MKKLTITTLVVALVAIMVTTLSGCLITNKWKDEGLFDLTLPGLEGAGLGEANANDKGWYEVFTDNFDGDTLNSDIWTYSPHAMRWKTDNKGKDNQTSYWCPNMVSVKNGNVEVLSEERTNHECDVCPSAGRFSGGIETRKLVEVDGKNTDELLFSQAFGYFETRVKFPDANGLWSAFWLQATHMGKIGSEGLDGTEIDVYESAFQANSTRMGHALLWNGYAKQGKVDGYILDTKKDLYDGYHTYALKWTPSCYVFYIDGVPTWSSNEGGVSKVKEFLRLTVEIDAGDGYGPHGQKIGKFKKDTSEIFYVDYVKVYQNTEYLPYVISDSMFPGNEK